MKKLVILFLSLLVSSYAIAQLEVKNGSFKEVMGFVNIDPDKQTDDNDQPYSVLKIRTENITDKQRHELKFQGDAQTFFETEYRDGEVWLYISYYATFLKISHPDFSSTEFHFPFDMKPKLGYELTIANKSVVQTPKTLYNYLVVKADQPSALIYFDDVFIGEKEVSKSYKVGEKHKWRIECEYYHEESGEVEIVLGDPMIIDKTLRPAFGYINVTSLPRNGIMVYIDGKRVGNTPYKSDRIKSGEHNVMIVSETNITVEKNIMVTDGDTTDCALNLYSNFINVVVTTDPGADIYIDNSFKGRGQWHGLLSIGQHVFEAKKTLHRTTTQTLDITFGSSENITLSNPEPIYGILDVNTTPMGATIIIDGKSHGTTPRVLNNIMIGNHELRLEKDGYSTITKSFTLEEKSIMSINEKLFISNNTTPVEEVQTKQEENKEKIKEEAKETKQEEVKKEKTAKEKQPKEKQPKERKNKDYDKYFFVTLNGAYSNLGDMSYGLTFGSIKKMGWFVSVMTNFNFSAFSSDYECGEDLKVNGNYPVYSGKEASTILSVMGGYVLRISEPIALRVGVGYGVRNTAYETADGKWVKNTSISASGFDASLGAQFKYGKFVFSIDGVTTNFKCFEGKLGIGMGF